MYFFPECRLSQKDAKLYACLISWLGACLQVRLRLPSLRTRAAQHPHTLQTQNTHTHTHTQRSLAPTIISYYKYQYQYFNTTYPKNPWPTPRSREASVSMATVKLTEQGKTMKMKMNGRMGKEKARAFPYSSC